jgi:ADP-ribose pyrophosphatase YjhB (NUDIX family)
MNTSRNPENPSPEQRPRLGCAGIIKRGVAVLLGKRAKDPNRGLWVLPGGGVMFGESFVATLEREVAEEAGIQILTSGVFKVYELINPPNEHRVIVYLNAMHLSGEPVPSSDLSEVKFFPPSQLKDLSERKLISPFVEAVLRDSGLL